MEIERGRMAQGRWEQEGRSELSVSFSCPLGGMIDNIMNPYHYSRQSHTKDVLCLSIVNSKNKATSSDIITSYGELKA